MLCHPLKYLYNFARLMDGEKFEALAYTQSIIKPDSIISWNNSFKKDFF